MNQYTDSDSDKKVERKFGPTVAALKNKNTIFILFSNPPNRKRAQESHRSQRDVLRILSGYESYSVGI
jgi:hypothetical protein